jgi:uncharacterized protein
LTIGFNAGAPGGEEVGRLLRRNIYNLTIANRRVRIGFSRANDRDTLVKFQPDSLAGVNSISRHDAASIWVAAQRYTSSVLVPWIGTVQPWPPRQVDDVEAAHFELLLGLNPELVIFGSGPRQRFVPAPLLRSLIERRIGFEAMDTGAACRTFNVLASEGRCVVAALLLDAAAA